MSRLVLLCMLLACARALQLEQEAKFLCGAVLFSNSKTSMYNMAFEVSENHIVKHWHFEFVDEGPESRKQLEVKSCVKLSYLGSFSVPRILLHNNPSNILIEKIVCVYPNSLTENMSIRNIPFFKEAFVNTTAYAGLEQQHSLVVTSVFEVSVPWIFMPWEGVLTSYVREQMAAHIKKMSARMCVDPRWV